MDMIERIVSQLRTGKTALTPQGSFTISKESFKKLPQRTSAKSIAFVDGGNLEVLRSPSLSLSFTRVYYTVYRHNRRIRNDRIEFYVLISTESDGSSIMYRTEYFPVRGEIPIEPYSFDAMDNTLRIGKQRAPIAKIGGVIRRFAELAIAKTVDTDYVVIDGSLEQTYVHENELLEDFKGCGLSKTSDLVTAEGGTVTAALLSQADLDTWVYDAGNMYFVKLHPKAKHVFKLESQDVEEVLCLLRANSVDPVFLGYPYGLIEADRFARVSEKEKERLQLQLKMQLKEQYKEVEPFIRSLDAHSILDSVG